MPPPRVVLDEQQIDRIFAHVNQSALPGVAVGISVDGHPRYRKGFGLASMELPVLLTPNTRMRIGSTTKHFACFAYMLLCEEGIADVDARLGSILPELNAVTHEVTVRQIMGHTSGLRDAHDIGWQSSGIDRPVPTNEVLALYQTIDDVNFAPAISWRYNNGAFVILTAVIERLARMPLERVLTERVFDPLGMYDSLLRRYDSDFVAESATMHMSTVSGGYDKSYLAGALAGEGGMVSTVNDMLRWLSHMENPRIGSAETWAAMKAPQRLRNGASTGYGLGLASGSYRGIETISHAGGMRGANAQMLTVPSASLDIIVLVNRHDVSGADLCNQILDACLFDGAVAKDEMTGARAALTGAFRSPVSGRIVQLYPSPAAMAAGETLQTVSLDGVDYVFLPPDAAGVLRPPVGSPNSIRWTVEAPVDEAHPPSVILNDFGHRDELLAIPEDDRSPTAAAPVGTYRSESTRAIAEIRLEGGSVHMRTLGPFGQVEYDLRRIGKGTWRSSQDGNSPLGGILTFADDGTSFSFSTYCNTALRFHKTARELGKPES